MPFHSQTIVQKKCGFKSTWEIDEQMIDNSRTHFATKLQTVKGMPDVEWHLICDNYVPVDFLLCVESDDEIEYSLKYNFLSHFVHSKKSQHFSKALNPIRLLRIEKEDFPKYVKNGKITFELEANFSYQDAKLNDDNISDAAKWGLRWKEKIPEDFSIDVDGQTIGVHKNMLAVESPVFEKMFESNFKEAKESKVTITDFKKEIIQAAMDYCYRQDITQILKDHQKSMELLRFCDKYDFQTLKPKLEKQIIGDLSKENVFYIASKADAVNSPEVRQACLEFIRPLLINTQTWPNLDMPEMDESFFKDLVSGAFNKNIKA